MYRVGACGVCAGLIFELVSYLIGKALCIGVLCKDCQVQGGSPIAVDVSKKTIFLIYWKKERDGKTHCQDVKVKREIITSKYHTSTRLDNHAATYQLRFESELLG